jgi:nitronate monooxygenase/enoyl-[acyl-carrier protein] reductase II
MGVFTAAELVAAVCNAGGLGSLGSANRPVEDLKRQVARIRELTDRPFAVNHLVPTLSEESFQATLEARPAVISLSLGDPGHLVERAHAAGSRVMQQVHTVQQARRAAEQGIDIIIAAGGEAGGFGGAVAALTLVPQVVDAVHPIPVVASGGIADGRGLAAALVLGAQGINLGTRFLASVEAPIDDGWKRAILAAQSEDAIKVDFWNEVIPLPGTGGYGTVPRAIRTPFIDEWQAHRDEARRQAERLQGEVMVALQAGRFSELVPFAGQTAGAISDLLPAGEIVRRLVLDADEALGRAAALGR